MLSRAVLWAILLRGLDGCADWCDAPPADMADYDTLLFGDSVTMGWAPTAAAMLAGVASAHAIPLRGEGSCGTSRGALACAALYRADLNARGVQFDTIVFNWGLHDIAADKYAFVDAAEYAVNVAAIAVELCAMLSPRGSLVWVTTTPVGDEGSRIRSNGDVIALNGDVDALIGTGAIQADATLDLYALVVENCLRRGYDDFPDRGDCKFLQYDGIHLSNAGVKFAAVAGSAMIAQLAYAGDVFQPVNRTAFDCVPRNDDDKDTKLFSVRVVALSAVIVAGGLAMCIYCCVAFAWKRKADAAIGECSESREWSAHGAVALSPATKPDRHCDNKLDSEEVKSQEP
ncbi:hypothetical protein M885DRAFT_506823 [Pelagophyceae sp. CCMP2097]|nr:hypothetical protein M885DRAFT_506823 [Pelagophyceae sp. CCMP2097]